MKPETLLTLLFICPIVLLTVLWVLGMFYIATTFGGGPLQ